MDESLSTLLGIIISSIVTLLIAFVCTRRFNYNQLFANTVSQSRNQWLQELREDTATMLAEAVKAQNSFKPKEYYIARNNVLVKLSPTEPKHEYLKQQIYRLDNCTVNDYNDIEKQILFIVPQIVKEEWERVKDEAKGKRR